MSDILGKAILDWHRGKRDETLGINNRYGEPEEMPVNYYFRRPDELPELEAFALEHCRGRILDIGAGAGAHAIPLQMVHEHVDALEISPEACEVLRERGVSNVICEDINSFVPKLKYDTILLLMNGIGMCQIVDRLPAFLQKLKSLLAPNGQIIFDSSDVHYVYDNAIDPVDKPTDRYYGEIDYQYTYKNHEGEWFKWLYIDYALCAEMAKRAGFDIELLGQDDEGHYLCRLTHRA